VVIISGISRLKKMYEELLREFPFSIQYAYSSYSVSSMYPYENIQVILHLSGNSLGGTFPQDVQLSSSIESLIISNNYFRGSLPKQILQHPFYYLDLSFNQFTDTVTEFQFNGSGKTYQDKQTYLLVAPIV
jgi:hypothetical protein